MKDGSGGGLIRLARAGQSVWLDGIGRGMIRDGSLARLVTLGVSGVTSNPTLFDHAIRETGDYDVAVGQTAESTNDVYDRIVCEDISAAAGVLAGVYRVTGGNDGFASLEVSPEVAYDADGTVREAVRLRRETVGPNVMIKVPATRQGLLALRRLTATGMSVNVTLIFSLRQYRRVLDAYTRGLEDRASVGEPLEGIRSVASFFLSRVDRMVDAELDRRIAEGGPRSELFDLKGKAAWASAAAAYGVQGTWQGGGRSARLAELGARPQRLLWASTTPKGDQDPVLRYVEGLVGPGTINTMSERVLTATEASVRIDDRLTQGTRHARKLLTRLGAVGIDLPTIGDDLQRAGVAAFMQARAATLRALGERCGRSAS